MTKQELLAALTAERNNGGGWATPPPEWNATDHAAGERLWLLERVEREVA